MAKARIKKSCFITIDQAWQSYKTVVIPKNASHVQIRETRRAFIAGAAACLDVLATKKFTGNAFNEIQTEFENFNQDVIQGEA